MAIGTTTRNASVVKSCSSEAGGIFMAALASGIGRNMICWLAFGSTTVMATSTARANAGVVKPGALEGGGAMAIRTLTCSWVCRESSNRCGTRGDYT